MIFFILQQFVDLRLHNLCIHIFSLNDDVPNTLTLDEEEELSAANHWLLPAGQYDTPLSIHTLSTPLDEIMLKILIMNQIHHHVCLSVPISSMFPVFL